MPIQPIFWLLTAMPGLLDRHGRACPGHPRLALHCDEGVDARDKPGHDASV
jgi:hypothetical protein